MDHSFDARSPASPNAFGCCSAYAFPPLVVLGLAAAFIIVAFRSPSSLPAPAHSTVADAGALASGFSPVFTPEVQYWRGAVARWAADAGLDPNLAAAVMQIESCGDPRALSRAGAIGLFQVMPYHFGASDQPYSPDSNARRGLAYLARALTAAEGNIRLAFAGYNGGLAVIARPEWTWPAETVRYAYWGAGIYAEAVSGAATSARLNEWLAAGGASLCRHARASLHLEQ